MSVNYESLALFGKFGGGMLGLLLLVWLIAVITPKAAALLDKIAGKKPSPERVQDNITSENDYKVYSIFEDRPNGAVNGASESSGNPDGNSAINNDA